MVRLMNGDARDKLALLEDESIDLVVTSPPYDSLRDYDGTPWDRSVFRVMAQGLVRVLKPGGVIVWIVNDMVINGSESGTSFYHALYFKRLGLNLHDTMIWNKGGSISFPDRNRYQGCFEYMFVLSKGKPKSINLIRDKPNKYTGTKVHGTNRQKNGTTVYKSFVKLGNGRKVQPYGIRLNIWDIQPVKSSIEQTGHPAQFPESLAYDHIITWSDPGDIVLDPFMGSGTTGVCAIKADRNFIGMEVCREYYDMARKRLRNFKKSLDSNS